MPAKIRKSTRSTADSLTPATEKDVRVRVFEGHGNFVVRVAMPEDGRFALTSSLDGNVLKWELDNRDALSEIASVGHPFALAVTTNGSHAATGDTAGTICFLDLGSGQVLAKWQAHAKPIRNLAFLTEGHELLSVAEDNYLQR